MKEIINPYGFIYITTNLINGKRYIGQRKFTNGWRSYLGSGKILKQAIEKLGRENFERNIVAITYSKEELDKLEIEWIENYNAVNDRGYYNIAFGGSGVNVVENYNCKKVVCLNSNITYDSISDAARENETEYSSIHACCEGDLLSSGKSSNGEKLIWAYYEDYLNMSLVDIADKIQWANNSIKGKNCYKAKKVVCLNSKEVFNTLQEAAKYYDCNYTHISCCCNGKRRFCGRDSSTNKQLAWAYYEDFIKMTDEEIQVILSKSDRKNVKVAKRGSQVLCVTTGMKFISAKKASEYYKVDSSAIIKNCNKKAKSAGSLNDGTRLVWEYIHKCKA